MPEYTIDHGKFVEIWTGATAAGTAPNTFKLKEKNRRDHTVQAILDSVTSFTLVLEGSIDGTNWFDLATHIATNDELTDGKLMFHIVNKPVAKIRARIDVFTGTSATIGYQSSY